MKKFFPLFAVIIVLVLAVCSFHIIPTGYTGVKTSFGQIQKTTIQSGKLNFCIPFVQSIHKVNNKQQDKHIEAQEPRVTTSPCSSLLTALTASKTSRF